MNSPKRNSPDDVFDVNKSNVPDSLSADLSEVGWGFHSETSDEASSILKLRQLGDRGLRAAMNVLKKDTSK